MPFKTKPTPAYFNVFKDLCILLFSAGEQRWYSLCIDYINNFMGDIKTLANQEAIEKIQELAKGQICLLCTHDEKDITSRPMSTSDIDAEGNLWFFSRKDSEKNREIKNDDIVYLMYIDNGKSHYLSIKGSAEIVVDRSKFEELWTPLLKAWFEDGKDDPNLSLLKVSPLEGHYWDTRSGKLVTMFKIAVAAVTGKRTNAGVEGDLKLSGR